jgi:hypothetical protein
MDFEERKTNWLIHGQHLSDVALELIGQCDEFDTTKGTRDPS